MLGHLAGEKRADSIDYSQLFCFTSDYFPMGTLAIQHSYKQIKKQDYITFNIQLYLTLDYDSLHKASLFHLNSI